MRQRLTGWFLLAASLSAAANCVTLGGRSYCAQPGGQAVLHHGNAYCSAGACVVDEFGNLFCSPYPGGGAIRAKGAFYAGPGMCLLAPDGSAQCAAQPGGSCQVGPGAQVQCDGGVVAAPAPAVRPPLCQ
ncbi:hypothetical protein [Chromobacterium sphagni]|uniref:Uncharacterized protein n=1 Tax=Chromobacterium sphagni TaxID=1903179 RepID=A0A1S1X0A6_9NEIS|nr:hypothetical protein [Chromobacterium sphagni]OHX12954.1 hypothetical protein BI347_05090 [Chromobacterium sphagni]OHX18867.1 hypothetical protein BI344_20010 [Chromobacterium sphagni]